MKRLKGEDRPIRAKAPSARYRAEIEDGAVLGGRCERCGYSTAPATPRCPGCGGATTTARFSARGTVWASTVVHIPVGDRQAPFGLAYVDIDGGPRVLALTGDPASPIGASVRLVQIGDDLTVETVQE